MIVTSLPAATATVTDTSAAIDAEAGPANTLEMVNGQSVTSVGPVTRLITRSAPAALVIEQVTGPTMPANDTEP